MEREIKFRLIKDGKIVGYEQHILVTYRYQANEIGIFHSTHGNPSELGVYNILVRPDKFIRHDTKDRYIGKEIYEGDILKDDCGEIGIVRFGKLPLDKSGDCVCTYLAYYVECKGKLGQAPTYECANIGDWMEVIGNIHDKNPELMEVEK